MASTMFRLKEVMERVDPVPSIRRLAKDAGLAYNTVFAIYHNKARRVDLETLGALAFALQCDPGEIIGLVPGQILGVATKKKGS